MLFYIFKIFIIQFCIFDKQSFLVWEVEYKWTNQRQSFVLPLFLAATGTTNVSSVWSVMCVCVICQEMPLSLPNFTHNFIQLYTWPQTKVSKLEGEIKTCGALIMPVYIIAVPYIFSKDLPLSLQWLNPIYLPKTFLNLCWVPWV